MNFSADKKKLYEIAHIFPNKPTEEEKKILADVEVLGDDSECFENKIALFLSLFAYRHYSPMENRFPRMQPFRLRANTPELDKSRPQKICEATRQTTLHTMLSISSRAMSSSAAMTR